MSERDLTVAMSSDTSGFTKGIQQAKQILLELNKTLVTNQSTLKSATQELNNYEKEQRNLQAEMNKAGGDTEENRARMEELTAQIQAQRERVAELRTEQTQLRGQISRATTALNEQVQAAKEATDGTEDLTEATKEQADGFTVLKGAIADLAADALQSAIDKFGELMVSGKQALNSIQAQTGMTAAEMAEMEEQMYDLYGRNYGESLEDVADVLADVKQNINETNPDNIKEIAKNAIAMNDVFGSDVEETLHGVNALMTSMGLTAEQAFNLIAKGSQNGLDKTHTLADNIAEYSQLWGQAGFSAEEMFSILQNGLDSGAYTLDKVNDYVGEFGKALADGRMGENIKSFSTETQNLFNAWKNGNATIADVFRSSITDLSNMKSQQEALTLATTMWGSLGEDNSMSVITALNNVNDTYANVNGTMQSINDIKYDDVGNQLATLGRKFEVDLIQPLVEGVTPALETILTWATDNLPLVTTAFTSVTTAVLGYKAAVNMDGVLNTVKNSFTGLITKIKGSAVASTEDAVAKTGETAATNSAKLAQDGLNASMSANPIMLVISAIATLAIGLGTYATIAQQATIVPR